MADAHSNFAVSAVATAPTPATSGTSLVVTTGHGTRFPTAPFNAVVHPAATDPTPANAEVVRVTACSTDTLTITRAQESSTARSITVGDVIYAAITAKSFTDIEAVDAVAATGSLRTLGTGAAQALAGNTRLDQITAPTAAVSLNSQKITNLAGPTVATDAATKAYADSMSAGLDPHGSVKCATTGNITLSGTQTIDGVAVVATDRVLVKNQTTTTENGIYSVGAGAWSRATDADTGAELTGGTFTFVEQGTTLAETGWVATHNGTPTLGTDPITFSQFSAASSTLAGDVTGAASSNTIQVRERLDRYVDYVNGNDSNDGLTYYRAKKTIQNAYDDLVTDSAAYGNDSNSRRGIGRIYLSPGDHQIGAGLAFDSAFAVELIGTRSGRISHDMSSSASRIISNSTTATSFVRITHANLVGMGFVFREIAFRVDDTATTGNVALTKVIYTTNLDYLVVERCSFGTVGNSANTTVTAIWQETDTTVANHDSAWARIVENNCSRMALYKAAGTSGALGDFNRSRIRDNVVFYGGSLPMIGLAADQKGLLCDGNNLEGSAVAIEIGPTGAFQSCTFLSNGGEDPSSGTPANAYYDVTGSCSGLIIIGGNIVTPSASGAGTFVRFNHANAYNNLVVGNFDANGATSAKRKVVDNSTTNGNVILHTNHRIAAKYKTGASAFSDSDFTTGPPPNGTIGVNGAGVVYARSNGSWVTVGGGNASWARGTGTYSASITPDVTGLSAWLVQINSTSPFTINAPTGMVDGQVVSFMLVNVSGGTIGDVTWNAAFSTDWSNAADKPSPTSSKRSVVTFVYSAGTTTWYQLAKMTSEHNPNHQASHQSGGVDALTGNIDAVAKLNVRKNSTGSVLSRRQLNFIEGSNVTLTVADDATDGEVDVTIAAAGGGGGNVATDTLWDTKGDLAVATGADAAAKLAVGTNLTHRLVPDSSQTTGLKWVPHIVRRTADSSTKASDTTLANDDTLLWAVGANEVWFFQAWLLVNSTGATGDVKFGFSVPSGATMQWGASGVAGASQPGYGCITAAGTPVAILNAAGNIQIGTLNGVVGVGLAGIVVVSSTAGNVNLQWAQATSNAETVKLAANSLLQLSRIA